MTMDDTQLMQVGRHRAMTIAHHEHAVFRGAKNKSYPKSFAGFKPAVVRASDSKSTTLTTRQQTCPLILQPNIIPK